MISSKNRKIIKEFEDQVKLALINSKPKEFNFDIWEIKLLKIFSGLNNDDLNDLIQDFKYMNNDIRSHYGNIIPDEYGNYLNKFYEIVKTANKEKDGQK